ncbi:MAG: class I SAM-dependent methyltransferase, partial [Bacteroidales bacterium]|nr:class I SAM-dependent methyltransferase [Bacteroidales bacterium]MBN2818474.1 class I SAM-dependent methyltransferase [Bacteroidales bacterium]
MENNPFEIFTAEYESWFKENNNFFQSELLALKQVVPTEKKGIEIGIGSGIFAEKLNIKFGIDPSENMLKLARQRNLTVDYGFAENLPYPDNSFDFSVFITSICFISNPSKALQEAHRVIKQNGELIIAFIDKESSLGQILTAEKKDSKFYSTANFYSVKEIISFIESCNFAVSEIFQTLTDLKKTEIEQPLKGFGKGSFVVIKGNKK